MCLRMFFVCLIFFTSLSSFSAWGEALIGVWSTEEEKSHVKIVPCGVKYCGSIIWLKEPLSDDGKIKYDANNPNNELRRRTIIGLPLLADFVTSTEDNEWESGTIYNPEDGKTYSCTLTLLNSKTLKVRGYVGLPLFGKTQIWKRVN